MRPFGIGIKNSAGRSSLIFEQLERRTLLAHDIFSLTADRIPDWVDSESACLAVASLFESAHGDSGSNETIAELDESRQELWVAPENGNPSGDSWRTTTSGEAGFEFGVPASATNVSSARVVALARETRSTTYDVSLSLSNNADSEIGFEAELRAQAPMELVEGQLVEFDISVALPGQLADGYDTINVHFEAEAKQSLEIIGLRLHYDTEPAAGGTTDPLFIAEHQSDARVIGHVVNGGNDNRSRLLELQLEFDQPVTVNTPAAIELINLSTNATQDISAASLQNNGTTRVTLDLTEVDLPNGRYRIELSRQGTAPPLEESFSLVDFVLRGDANGDQTVNFADFGLMSAHFGQTVERLGPGDLDGNGTVDFADFGIMSANMGEILTDEPGTR